SNDEVLGIVQIETADALAEVDDIAALDAVDVLFVGPLDLSYALGVPLDFDAPVFRDALEAVVAAARKHGKSAGILSPDAQAAATRAAQGCAFLPVGSDSTLLAEAATTVVSTLRDCYPPAIDRSREDRGLPPANDHRRTTMSNTPTTIGVGLISVGWMGQPHGRAYSAVPIVYPELG